ncbi:MAG: glycosyltransferase family 4 protein [Steroidobacteraceae bacterium]
MSTAAPQSPSICFVGLTTLPLLAPELGCAVAGGSELQQALLAPALARRGLEVSMVVSDYGQPDGARWHGVKTFKAYRPEAGIPALRFAHPRWTGLWSAMRRADADIYYLNCQGMQVGEAALFAKRHRRRLVYWVASDSDCDPRALLIRYARDRKLFTYGLRRADLVLAQTQAQQAALERNFGRESLLVDSLVEPGGAPLAPTERDVDVLWVGNIRALKRPLLLLEIARELPRVRFEMVGGPAKGAEALYDEVARRAAALPNVRFHGFLPYERTAALYAGARVLASTSAIEGLPNAYLQSFMSGTPVVGFLDPEQMITRHGLGRAVSTPAEMSAAIVALLSRDTDWSAASRACIRYMSARYGEAHVVTPYVEAFMKLCAAPGNGPRKLSHATSLARGLP